MGTLELPFHQPSLSALESQYLLEALEDQYWGGGQWVERVEAALEQLYQRHVVVVNSGTSALHLLLTLLVERGDEVIVPTWTFTATASAVVHAGGVPVLADVNPSLHLSAEAIEALITPQTRGVIVVHYGGVPAPLEEIQKICEHYHLWLVEDACHAVPAWYKGKLCGTFGIAATLSFHATKPIAAGQGGAIIFSEKDYAERARLLRRNGIRRLSNQPWLYEVEALGWNYMLSDFQAAVALAQIERMQETWSQRLRLALQYTEALATFPELEPYPCHDPNTVAWHLYPVFWRGTTADRRDLLLQRLWRRGIRLGVHYKPLHLHPAYKPYIREKQQFPTANQAFQEIFSLPLWPDMPLDAVDQLLCLLREEIKSI
ncbi:MAG: DegT/DnrJ/EryC1/StrS family aminotransferase [Bacteroidia bacterium]|nr:DegT/DnrJ/EryC1/StrS family aminotransferase [Bacteroidia bacterium]MDW8014745.1 DegT/DnrJ/EryC1/StrS family aminotransferase [Bacteroidia bacterium]